MRSTGVSTPPGNGWQIQAHNLLSSCNLSVIRPTQESSCRNRQHSYCHTPYGSTSLQVQQMILALWQTFRTFVVKHCRRSMRHFSSNFSHSNVLMFTDKLMRFCKGLENRRKRHQNFSVDEITETNLKRQSYRISMKLCRLNSSNVMPRNSHLGASKSRF